jgi:hypothetical protein
MRTVDAESTSCGIVRCLQAVLRDPWLATAVDETMPASMQTSDAESNSLQMPV